MNLDTFVNTYGVFALILIYVVVNVAYKNLLNLIIFIVVLLATMGIFDNKINAVILAYIISILYGIVKNFHLLENFNTKSSNSNPIEQQEQQQQEQQQVAQQQAQQLDIQQQEESAIELNISESANIIKNTENKNIPDMDLVSSKLIKSFVKKLKQISESNVYYKKIDIDDLQPTIRNINKTKLDDVTDKIRSGSIPEKVYISSDNFILEGHYTWFSLKTLSNTNDAKYGDTIDVVLIDMPIKKVIMHALL